MSSWLEGRVTARRAWTGRLHSIEVEAPALTFAAGQFARLALPAPPGAKEPMIGRVFARPKNSIYLRKDAALAAE